ncbi:hypothetical protein GCM10007919_01370 [Rhizobium indigoferae]|nr:hypothetical protein GCM10007919_01370 [Rhizobium indigoferae]
MLEHQCRYLIVAKGEFTNGGLLIKRRKAAEAHDVSGENGCKLSIHSGHRSSGGCLSALSALPQPYI